MNSPLPYPISRATRIAIMLFLIACFFISAPLVILYTAGYRYNFDDRSVLTTGVLSIDIETPDVEVRVNDTVIHDEPPIRLSNLTPGLYSVEITRFGYHPWKNTVQVSSNQTSYIQDIELTKDRIPITSLYSSSSTQPQSLSPQGEHLYYLHHSTSGTQHMLLHLPTTQSNEVWTLPKQTLVRTQWAPYSPLFLFEHSPDTASQELAVMNASNPTNVARYRDVSFRDMQWPRSTQEYMYAQVGPWIERFTPTSQELLQQSTSSLWFVANDNSIWEYTSSSQMLEHQQNNIFLPMPISDILDIQTSFILSKREGGYIQLFKRNGNSIIDSQQIVADASWYDHQTNNWYVWSLWEVWKIPAGNGEAELLHRSSAPLQFVYPLDDKGLLLFVSNNSLIAFDSPYYSHYTLYTAENIRDVSVDMQTRKIHFIGHTNGVEGVFELDY